MTLHTRCVVASPGPSIRQRRVGAMTHPRSNRKQCGYDARLGELIALSLLAGLGCGWPTVTCFSSLFLAVPSQ
jgi:hypothetical protein